MKLKENHTIFMYYSTTGIFFKAQQCVSGVLISLILPSTRSRVHVHIYFILYTSIWSNRQILLTPTKVAVFTVNVTVLEHIIILFLSQKRKEKKKSMHQKPTHAETEKMSRHKQNLLIILFTVPHCGWAHYTL